MTRIAIMIAAAAAIALATSCSSGGSADDGGTQNPSVDGTKQISTISTADKTSLCKWFAGLVGGYGSTPACTMALITAPPSEAECISSFPTCAVPVSTFETCVRAVVSAQETCTTQSISMAQTTPECVTVGQAGCFN